jgi:anti-sigma B factor antagonist
MSGLQVEIDARPDGAVVVSLIGSADIAGAEALDRQLTPLCARHPKHVVFDLRRLEFISSLCMGALVSFGRGCHGWGGAVFLTGARDPVATALRRARLDRVLPMRESVEAALATDPPPSQSAPSAAV